MVRKERQSVVKGKRAGWMWCIVGVGGWGRLNKHQRSVWLSKTSEKISKGIDVKRSDARRINYPAELWRRQRQWANTF